MAAWVLTALAAAGIGAALTVAWSRFKESSLRGRAGESARRAARALPPPGPVIGGVGCAPIDIGWVNCDCMPEAIVPTVYDQVVVVVLTDCGGEGHPDWRLAIRCRACGRLYLPAEMVERARAMGAASRERGLGVAGRGIKPR